MKLTELEVEQLQKSLRVVVTGHLDMSTQKAIRNWQLKYGHPLTGEVTEEMWFNLFGSHSTNYVEPKVPKPAPVQEVVDPVINIEENIPSEDFKLIKKKK